MKKPRQTARTTRKKAVPRAQRNEKITIKADAKSKGFALTSENPSNKTVLIVAMVLVFLAIIILHSV